MVSTAEDIGTGDASAGAEALRGADSTKADSWVALAPVLQAGASDKAVTPQEVPQEFGSCSIDMGVEQESKDAPEQVLKKATLDQKQQDSPLVSLSRRVDEAVATEQRIRAVTPEANQARLAEAAALGVPPNATLEERQRASQGKLPGQGLSSTDEQQKTRQYETHFLGLPPNATSQERLDAWKQFDLNRDIKSCLADEAAKYFTPENFNPKKQSDTADVSNLAAKVADVFNLAAKLDDSPGSFASSLRIHLKPGYQIHSIAGGDKFSMSLIENNKPIGFLNFVQPNGYMSGMQPSADRNNPLRRAQAGPGDATSGMQ